MSHVDGWSVDQRWRWFINCFDWVMLFFVRLLIKKMFDITKSYARSYFTLMATVQLHPNTERIVEHHPRWYCAVILQFHRPLSGSLLNIVFAILSSDPHTTWFKVDAFLCTWYSSWFMRLHPTPFLSLPLRITWAIWVGGF